MMAISELPRSGALLAHFPGFPFFVPRKDRARRPTIRFRCCSPHWNPYFVFNRSYPTTKATAIIAILVVLCMARTSDGVQLVVMSVNTTAIPGAKVFTVGVKIAQSDLTVPGTGNSPPLFAQNRLSRIAADSEQLCSHLLRFAVRRGRDGQRLPAFLKRSGVTRAV
jgi:hypothetical protein